MAEPAPSAREAAQRPIIQQQQHEWNGDEHRLAHQARAQRRTARGECERPTKACGRSQGRRPSVRTKNSPLSTSFRSATQATDSTRTGARRKETRQRRVRSRAAGHPPEDEIEADRGHGMQQDAGQVMAAGPKPVELAIEHVRERRQRMPVDAQRAQENDARSPCERQAGADFTVLVDVLVIIKIDERVAGRLPINGKH